MTSKAPVPTKKPEPKVTAKSTRTSAKADKAQDKAEARTASSAPVVSQTTDAAALVPGPDGYFHTAWVWRLNRNVESDFNVNYARSKDLKHWFSSDGKSLGTTLTPANTEGRPEPVGLELQMLRMLVAHPSLALTLDESALAAFEHFGQDGAERLRQLAAAAQALGENGSFAALSEQLKEAGTEYDRLIAEIASEPESDLESDREWLASAVRQIKMDALKMELNQLFSSGLTPDQVSARYREITAQQDLLAREAAAVMAPR